MAKNWTLQLSAEALKGTPEEVAEFFSDCGRRFPISVASLTTLHALACQSPQGALAFDNIFESTPDWMTMRKLEAVLKTSVAEVEDDEEEEVEEEEKPAKKEKAAKKAAAKKAKKEEVEEEEDEDDDEEEEKPAKKAKKAAVKKTKKEEVEEEDEDDDDDWD